jgi:hypothetical protein
MAIIGGVTIQVAQAKAVLAVEVVRVRALVRALVLVGFTAAAIRML